VLYAADLRKIIGTFESAYNILQRAEGPRRRMRRSDRLTVRTVRTGNNIELTVLGGMALVALREIVCYSERVLGI
jgi:hypothetical protein